MRPALPTIAIPHFSMTREADLATVLRALARGAGLNLVLGTGVSGPVQVSLSEETRWDRLFELIVATHGLHYEFQDGLLQVLSKEDIDRAVAMENSLRERDLAREQRRRAEPAQLEIYRVRYADAKQLAESVITGFGASAAGPTDQARVTVTPDLGSGLLVIQSPASSLAAVMQLVRSLDQPVYQVLIEATIVQTTSETARDLGIQWGAGFFNRNTNKLNYGTAINPDGFNAAFPAGFGAGEAGFTFGLEYFDAKNLLQMQLSALQRDGRLHIVSSPSITTLDLQTATIESGEERPFQSAQGTGAGTTTTVEFKEALLSLEVTPQVIDGTWIKLRIKTTQDDFDDSRAILIDGAVQVPIITRAATTQLYLADGQTTVIGGLSTASRINQSNGLPFLHGIPVLGHLFGNTNDRDTFGDTLIFLTPRIIGLTTPVLPSPPPVEPPTP